MRKESTVSYNEGKKAKAGQIKAIFLLTALSLKDKICTLQLILFF